MAEDMRSLALIGGDVTIEGAVSVEETAEGVHPWRLPVDRRDLFEPSVVNKASMPAGVRLTFVSDTASVRLDIVPPGVEPDPPWVFDLLVDGELHQRLAPPPDAESLHFTEKGWWRPSGRPSLKEEPHKGAHPSRKEGDKTPIRLDQPLKGPL